MTEAPAPYGRDTELGRLRDLVCSARAGRGGGVVLLGEAGMGRTTLLRHLRSEASGFHVVGTTGVAAECDLPLGALHRILEPVALRITMLPTKMAEAVRYAAGRGGTPDQFLLSCGVHRMLVGLAEAAPLLCWVDDAHWLDQPSLDVLGFVARRIADRRIAVALTGRPELVRPGRDAVDGIDRVWLPALADADCERLLRDRLARRIPPGVRAMLVELAAGNPLDLIELADSLDADQLAGRTPLPDQLPDGGQRIRYRERLAELSPWARQVVLLAAAEPTIDLDTLRRSTVRTVVREALDSGLLRAEGPVVRLPSPVVRATLYAEASGTERLAAHAVLASVLTDDRQIWHRAMAGAELDPGMADELATAAVAADAHDTASLRWERSGLLTIHNGQRGERMLAAAQEAWHAGQSGRARSLLAQARMSGTQAVIGAATVLHGEIELRDGEPALATHELAEAAGQLAGRDRGQAAVALMLAGEARRIAGDLPGYAAIAQQAAALYRRGDPPVVELTSAHFAGVAATFAGRHPDAVEALSRAIRIGRAADDVRSAVWASQAAFALGRVEQSHECAGAAVSRARLTGESALLPWSLAHFAVSALALDRHRSAVAAALDGLAAATSAAQRNCAVLHLLILALAAAQLGDRDAALSRLDAAAPEIADRGLGSPSAIASWAHACLDLAADRPADALGRFDSCGAGVGAPQRAFQTLATPQVVEAAVRCEQPERAERALDTFDGWVADSGSPLWHALSHRCHALLASGAERAEQHFQTAIRLHRRGGAALELARTELIYAQRLRRQRRPDAARVQLREAVRIFRGCGADAWAEHARAQLRAVGEPASPPGSVLAGLTPQQVTISRLVAAGETNREIARRLVISHRTVDHHLRNIFATLGVRSRVELTRKVATLDRD